MFDAGSVEASLTVRTDQFNRDMDAAEARVRRFESDRHEVKIAAVFDQSSTSHALQQFAQLDNQISRDAMNRLRSSPQGSVLGAINALFSPHPVTGAPTAQQAGAQGLLGQMISAPGGGAGSSVLRQAAAAAQPRIPAGQPGAGQFTTTDTIMRNITGAAPGDVTTKDTVKTVLDPASAAKAEADAKASGDRSGGNWFTAFTGHIRDLLPRSATDTAEKAAGDSGHRSGAAMGSGLLSGIGPGILGISAKASLITAGVGSALATLPALAGVAGVGAGVALIGGITAIVSKSAISAVAPATQAFQALQNAAPGPKQTAALAAYQHQLSLLTPAQQALAKSLEGAQTAWQNFVQSNTAGVSKIISGGLGLLPGILKSMSGVFQAVVPQMASVFQSLGGLVQGLIGVAKTAVPAFAPFVNAILGLITNILPGINVVIKATLPYIGQFAAVLGGLGKDLGGFFAAAAPAVGASMKVLSSLLGVVGSLLPVIMQLAGVFAKALAPVLTEVGKVIIALEPTLLLVGKVIASLAGAVLGDLVAAFSALATFAAAAAPGLNILASALGQVFTVLENSGVFAVLGDALEKLAAPLGNLVTALAKSLVPVLPPVIQFISQLAGLLVGSLASAVTALLPSLTQLATTALGALASILPQVLPLLTTLAGIFTAALVSAIAQVVPPLVTLATQVLTQLAGILPQVLPPLVTMLGAFTPVLAGTITLVAGALAAIITAIPPSVLTGIALAIGGIILAVKAWAIAQAILNIVLDANPIGLIILALAALGIGITLLVTHWNTVWHAITAALDDAWGHINSAVLRPMEQFFLVTIPGWWDAAIRFLGTKFVTPLENGLKGAWTWVVTNVADPVKTFFTVTLPGYWTTAIGFLNTKFVTPFENGIKGAWTWVVTNVFNPMKTFVTSTVPGWFSTAVTSIGAAWNKIEQIVRVPVAWVVNNVLNPIGQTFDAITGALGLGRPVPALKMASGGRLAGYGGGDIVPALLEPGETVIDKDKSRQYGWLFKMMGVPGYAAGGIIPGIITGAVKGAIDAVVPGLGSALGLVGSAVSSSVVQAALGKILGLGTGGAGGDMKNILATMGSKAVSDLVTWFTGKESAAAAASSAAAGIAGAGVQQWKGLVDQALKMLGLPASLDAKVLYQMQTESGGNPNAINLTDSNAAAGDPSRGLLQTIGCFTLDYMILTKRGWLRHDQVQPGDKTIGYNPATGRSEWTAILAVLHYEDAEVWRIGNRHWHAEVTPNHRWWSDTLLGAVQPAFATCPECGWVPRGTRAPARGVQVHRNKIHGIPAAAKGARDRLRGEFVTTDALRSHHRLRLAALADTDGIPGLSLEDVRVIAWLQGDGTISQFTAKPVTCPECGWLPGTERHNPNPSQPGNSVAVHRAQKHGMTKDRTHGDPAGYDGTIWQSKPSQVVRLRALLAGIEHTEAVRQRTGSTLPAHAFRLRRAYVTDLLKRSGLMESGPEAFVLALSPDQRAAWLDSMIDAEGNRQQSGTPAGGSDRGAGGEFVRIAQVDGPLQDAIKLAVFLEGYRPTYARLARHSDRHQPAGQIGMARPHVAPSMFTPHEVLERQPVWCVTTVLGTWTAQGDNGLPFLTGNSTFAAYHVAGTSGNIYDPLANIAAAINYAEHVYGPTLMSNGMGMGSGHGYDRGGYLRPGYTMAYNGTGRPEVVTPSGAGGATFDDVVARLDKLIRATEQVPAGVGAHVGGAINGAAADASFRGRYPRGSG